MAKQVIVLGVTFSGGQAFVQAAFWYVITSGAKTTGGGSAWSGASTAELAAIANGSILEELNNFTFPSSVTKSQVETILGQQWAIRNAQIGGLGPALFNGVFLDSVTGWSS